MRDRCSADGNGSEARLSPRVGSKPRVALIMPRLHTKILSSWSNTTSCAFELEDGWWWLGWRWGGWVTRVSNELGVGCLSELPSPAGIQIIASEGCAATTVGRWWSSGVVGWRVGGAGVR